VCSRFGRAFHTAEFPGAALTHLAQHGVTPEHVVRPSLKVSSARVLNLAEFYDLRVPQMINSAG
jgi:hypothetical protein